MIRLRDLRKEYGGSARALDGVNLEIRPSEFVALIGPSGAGKSSPFRCLNGLIPPTGGEVPSASAVLLVLVVLVMSVDFASSALRARLV